MAQNIVNVKKYTCDNCHYFFYLDDTDDLTLCPYCACEIAPFEIRNIAFAAG